MPDSTEFEKINRLHRGPLRLPREITSAQQTLRLFMAYLARPATMSALREVASEKTSAAQEPTQAR